MFSRLNMFAVLGVILARYVLILTTFGATEAYTQPHVTIAYDPPHKVALLRIELVDPSPEGIDIYFKHICQDSPTNTLWLFASHLSTQEGQSTYSWSDTNSVPTQSTTRINGRCYLILAGTLSTDRDDDGLTDLRETYFYGTYPNNPDSDGDGRTDRWEIAHHRDPRDPADGIKGVVTEIETVTLAWDAPTNRNVVGYNVYRRDHLWDSDHKLNLRIDGDFEDWMNISRINRYPYPPKAELFLKDMWAANDDQNLYLRIRSFDIRHQTFVFLDVDQNRQTGTQPSFRGLPIGADFRLRVAELGTNGVQVFLDPYNPAFAPWLRPRPDDEEAFLVSTTPLTNALYRLGNDDFNWSGLQNNGFEVQIPFAALGAVFPAGLVGIDLYYKMHSDYFPNVDYAPDSPSYYRYGYHRLNPAPVQEIRFQDKTLGGVDYDYAITAMLGDGGEVLVKSEEAVYVSRANPSRFEVSVVGTNTLEASWLYPEHAAIAGVRIVRGTEHFPVNQDDGTTVYEGTGTRYIDKGLSPATAYFYSTFGYTAERKFSAGCWDAKDRSTPTAPRGPIVGMDSSSDYLVYFGNWDDQRVRQAEKYQLVILHPGGGSPLITPEQVRDIRAGVDHILGTADDVKVIAYLSIGEDYGRPNPEHPGFNNPRIDLPAEFNDGLGPCYYDRVTGQIVFEKRGYPSFYVDEYDFQTNDMAGHDFYPDQNQEWGGFYVNSGDPKWQAFQKVATYETDGFAGLDYLAHTLKVDGFFLDTVGVSVPWSYWNTYRGDYYWIRDGHLDYLANIGCWYPEKIIMPNRPLHLAIKEVSGKRWDDFRCYCNAIFWESFSADLNYWWPGDDGESLLRSVKEAQDNHDGRGFSTLTLDYYTVMIEAQEGGENQFAPWYLRVQDELTRSATNGFLSYVAPSRSLDELSDEVYLLHHPDLYDGVPDLAVHSVMGKLLDNEHAAIVVKLRNPSPVDVNDAFIVELTQNHNPLGRFIVPGLKSNALLSLTTNLALNPLGNNIHVDIDPTNAIEEFDKSNNRRDTYLDKILFPAPAGVPYKHDPAPDLTLTGMALTPEIPATGSRFTMNVHCGNIGAAVTPSTRMYVWLGTASGGSQVGNLEIPFLMPGETTDVAFSHLLAYPGQYFVSFTADATALVSESNEANNGNQTNFYVLSFASPMLDWENSTNGFGAFKDSLNDGLTNHPSGDIANVWFAQDDKQWMFRMQTVGRIAPYQIKQLLFLDADGGANTGYRINNLGAEWMFINGDFYQYRGNGADWDWKLLRRTPEIRYLVEPDPRFVEWALPKELIALGTKGHLACQFAISDEHNTTLDLYPDIGQTFLFPPIGKEVRIDGRFGDWTNNSAVMSLGADPVNDGLDFAGNPAPSQLDTGADITQLLAAKDDRYLYLRIDSAGPIVFQKADYSLFLDLDANEETGYSVNWGTIGAEYLFTNGTLNRYAGMGVDWIWEAIEGGYSAVGHIEPEKMEIAIDRSAIGLLPDKRPRVFFLTSDHKGADWHMDINDYAPDAGSGGYSF